MSASDRFSLIDRPWLLARGEDGAVREVSLMEALTSAHRLLGLVGDVPTQVFAHTRLLLAILHRALAGPRDADEWQELWQADTLPADRIEAYLRAHAHRFDLADPREPFFQVAALRTTDGKVSELSRLIADVPNRRPFFLTTRMSATLTLESGEAARWLVHCQAFDAAGIKTGDPADPRTKGGKGYGSSVGWSGHLGGVLVAGRSLRDTMLLNLIPHEVLYSSDNLPADDRPPWERPQDGVAVEVEERQPTGPVDLFTWQSRRIRLAWDESGMVTGVLIANGDKRTPQNMHPFEPHTGWRRSQAQEKKLRSTVPVYMPLEHDPERAIWRGLQSMLPEADKPAGAERLTATVLEWIAQLTGRRVLDRAYPLCVRTIGMTYGDKSSTVAEIVDDELNLRAVLFARDAAALAGTVKQAVENSEAGATAIGQLAENLAVASGSREPAGPRVRGAEYAYGTLDPLFRSWLAALGPDSDPMDCLTEWHRTAADAMRALADEMMSGASPAAWVGRPDRKGRLITSTHARKWCDDALRVAFPHAHQQPVGSTS